MRRSLNLPAVALLARYGPQRFAAQLHEAGLILPPRSRASLPVILGGAGITLRKLMALYAALGTDGRLQPLRLLGNEPASRGRPFLSPMAASMVAGILTRPVPGGGPPGIAWKTGTSAGNRDSWAMGFDRTHLVGVWVGRPDGSARPGKAAADVALPILARVFGLLPPAPRTVPAMPSVASFARTPGEAMTLLFPPPAATISGTGPLTLRVAGGERPLTFLVDGAILPSDAALRETSWTPPSAGFYRVLVEDSAGRSAAASVRVIAGPRG